MARGSNSIVLGGIVTLSDNTCLLSYEVILDSDTKEEEKVGIEKEGGGGKNESDEWGK